MNLVQIYSKKVIASSSDQEKLFNSWYTVDNIRFRVGDFDKLYILENKKLWKIILSKIDGLKKSLINYQSKENLTLYGKQFNDMLLVISAGEKNKGLFIVVLEGVWKITSS